MGLIEWFGLNPNKKKPDFVPDWYLEQNPELGEGPYPNQYFNNNGTPESVVTTEPERVPDNEILPDLGENYVPVAPSKPTVPIVPSRPIASSTPTVPSASVTPLADAQEQWLFGGNMSKALVPTLFGRDSTKTDWYRENVWN